MPRDDSLIPFEARSGGRQAVRQPHGTATLAERRMPPSNSEAEQALLGALLASNKAMTPIAEFLKPEHFVEPVHGRIYAAIGDLVAAGKVANVITLKNLFDQDGALQEIGGAAYLVRLYQSVITVIGAESYARTIYDCFLRRRLLGMADDLIADAHDADRAPEATVAELVGELSGIATERSGRSKADLAAAIYDDLDKPRAIYPTGISTVDEWIGGGLIAGKLYGIAARKKVGKTILLGTVSHNLNRAGCRHVFIALEMGAEEIEQRNIAREMGFNSFLFLKSDNPAALRRRVGDYAARSREWDNTIFEHRPGASFDDIKRIVARAILNGATGIILDYWQLVTKSETRESEEYHLRMVAQYLADIARKQGVWVLVACQVNQEGNTRGGEGLKLACDMYLTLHREKDQLGAWLEMEESRFTQYSDIGSETMPGLWLHKIGPHFSAEASPVNDHYPEQRG